jgi:hypothetical protein
LIVCAALLGKVQAQDNALRIEDLPYIGSYRLVATAFEEVADATGAVFSPGIGHAGMNADGTLIAWSSFIRPNATIYLSDFDGTNVQATQLDESLGNVWEFEVGGNRAILLSASNGIWAVDAAGAHALFTLNEEIPRVHDIEVTADGEWVYFVAAQGRNQDDIYAQPAAQGTPQRVVDNANIPCPAVENCKAVWTVASLALSADAGTMASVIGGYFVEDEAGNIIGVDHDEVLVLSGDGYRYITDGMPFGTIMGYLALSPDGGTAVFATRVFDESLTEAPMRWVALDSDGAGGVRSLPEQPFNHDVPSLLPDGSVAFLDLSKLVLTDGSGEFDLFPSGNIRTVALASTSNLAIDSTGRRIAFTIGNAAFYTGSINDVQALARAPIQITNVSFTGGDEVVLTVTTEGPVERMSLDAVHDGVLLDGTDAPWKCAFAPHDDGTPPDVAAGDGQFTTTCVRQGEGDIALRIGAATRDQGWVVVMDVPIGTAV